MIRKISERSDLLIQELIELWKKSVQPTHYFLSTQEIQEIKAYVPLKGVQHLLVYEIDHEIIAFMGIENQRLEMLFILPTYQGKGIGKQLIQQGFDSYQVSEVTVNEQNPQAVGFYEHLGFHCYKRTDEDEQGQPYPLLYMKLEK